MSDELCVFCKNRLEGDLTVKVTQKGLNRIRESSVKRDDGLLPELNLDLTVHVKCRKSYISEDLIKAYKKKKLLLTAAERSSPIFNFELNCFFCGTEALEVDNTKSHVGGVVRRVKMIHTKESIKEMALRRNDISGETVLQRIQDVNLVAVAARYHSSCYNTFRLTEVLSSEGQRKRGRPESDTTSSAMEDIYRFVEENCDECQFSLAELKNSISGACPDDRTILKKLQEKYGDKLIISKLDGKSTVFCFRNTSSKILHEAWQTAKSKDEKGEKLKIIRTAASILLDDIRIYTYVIDGGYLLHKVIWPKGATFSTACDHYVKYVKSHFPHKPVVVFDGYPDEPQDKGTKTTERSRRENNKRRTNCTDILFTGETAISVTQEHFLSNSRNKKRFIALLREKMEINGIKTKQATEDGDTLIVQTALEIAKTAYYYVFIVGEDIDLLVILNGSQDEHKNKVLFLKPGKNKVPRKLYTSNSFAEEGVADHVLFIHAFSGCDTTSALFRLGKKKVVQVLKKNTMLHEKCSVFKDPNAERDSVIKAGEIIMASLYFPGSENSLSINDLRYEMFARSITKSKFNLASLPPTSGATTQHSLRTYCQVQCWLGNKKEPKNWGWKFENGYQPIKTLDDPAPAEILSVISCKCKTSCGRNCTCKKAALNCTAICNDCHGKPCTGSISIDEHDEPDEEETLIEKLLTGCSESGQPYDSDMEPDILPSHNEFDDDKENNIPESSFSKRSRY